MPSQEQNCFESDTRDRQLWQIYQAYQPKNSVPSSSEILTAAGDDILSIESGDYGYIQNLGTNPLYVKIGDGASNTSFNYVLPGGTADDDGNGGTLILDKVTGDISVAGTDPRFIAWKAS